MTTSCTVSKRDERGEKLIGRPDSSSDLSENIRECGVHHPQDLIEGRVHLAAFPYHAPNIEHADKRVAIVILADLYPAMSPDPEGDMRVRICERCVV